MEKQEQLHTIKEWEDITKIEIIDPDGFDRTDEHLYNRLMSKKRFIWGAMRSTIRCRSMRTLNGHLTKKWEKEYYTLQSKVETKSMPLK